MLSPVVPSPVKDSNLSGHAKHVLRKFGALQEDIDIATNKHLVDMLFENSMTTAQRNHLLARSVFATDMPNRKNVPCGGLALDPLAPPRLL
jgi:hypothetical protein